MVGARQCETGLQLRPVLARCAPSWSVPPLRQKISLEMCNPGAYGDFRCRFVRICAHASLGPRGSCQRVASLLCLLPRLSCGSMLELPIIGTCSGVSGRETFSGASDFCLGCGKREIRAAHL